jgi:hypothetical protein
MEYNRHLFDFSNYDKDHPLYDTPNAKTPGLFKDETGGVPIQQFVGLRREFSFFMTVFLHHVVVVMLIHNTFSEL